ncbi:hypothetical protein DIU31_031975 [Mucilaginibacter rubeus]|uniref:Right handed beta helix domain-containing protein n=1 Tax=Mucilaginibacter rubeus TaxID=2027860 RepID=A0AAE6JLV9_9SPHI|nr:MULTISPECIES: hypothetical protein [Mucilaginibacter]QEM07900.1 hypothetical protein DIU31_031975 [Mucilaginibacter rubeus]QEM20352.1 hypothetical protein DIU38_031580 [Mucilaginibacter gossypii]QTE42928.1 hypothetical protein J3L19_29075 [Mucilaginibacter rubeus]QTE49529.1 hypothetical protein J3L21_29035 [Mucilaginibacter rubeus]QTE54625.1 hypothetical protein J3L23_20660 [Mucilaginibacter rubeus]
MSIAYFRPIAKKIVYNYCFAILFIFSVCSAEAQSLYVDPLKGNDQATGTLTEPLASLDKAVSLAKDFTGNNNIDIKLAPGLYVVTQSLKIESNTQAVSGKFTIGALVMPDDPEWTPAKMPVIQVTADANRIGKLSHASVAFQVERNHVALKGLKFLGNPNPASVYFYAIERRNNALKGLEISQCYFIGEKNSAPIQGGIFAQGEGIHIDHCIFYNCKNAVLSFLNVKDFSITHSIIYGAYEAAIWLGYGPDTDLPFTFHDNIVANGNYFWVGDKGIHKNYLFSNSVISGNANYLGINGDTIKPDQVNKPTEKNIDKSGKVFLSEITAEGVPRDYLNLSGSSAGREIDAGIFINKKAK